MTPHLQMFRHDPENGVHGDCFRTAIACLLDMAPGDVPHFNSPELIDMNAQNQLARDWLAERGLALIEFAWPAESVTFDELIANLRAGAGSDDLHFMLTGQSPRGTCHVVIANGSGIVHDPHPDGGGLVGPSDGFWWGGFIGRLV